MLKVRAIPEKLEKITYPIVSFEKLKKQARQVEFQSQKDKNGSEKGQEKKNEGTDLSQEGQICPSDGTNLGIGRDKKNTLPGTDMGNHMDSFVRTNTENTSNTIPENTTIPTTTLLFRDNNLSINPSSKSAPCGLMDKIDREKLKEQIKKNISYDSTIKSLDIMDRDLFEEMY